ncbi:transposase [Nostoc sp.]
MANSSGFTNKRFLRRASLRDAPHKKLVEELMPNVDVTADRFHVTKFINLAFWY